MSGHGWEKTLLPRQLNLIKHLEGGKGDFVDYRADLAWPYDVSHKQQASVNHKANAWTGELLRAVMNGTDEQYQTALRVVLDGYVPRELGEGPRGVGLWAHETGCPDTHGGQHLAAVGTLVVAALLAQEKKLADANLLMIAARRLFEANISFLLSVAVFSRKVWSPGVRSPGAPVSSGADKFLEVLHGENSLDGNDIEFPNYVGTRALIYARDRWNLQPYFDSLRAGPVKLHFPISVWRWDTGHLAVMDTEPGPEIVRWAAVDHFTLTWDRGSEPAPNPPADVSLIRHTRPGDK